ncbi:hypothetical protein ES703_42820 [subsurface metagenome]
MFQVIHIFDLMDFYRLILSAMNPAALATFQMLYISVNGMHICCLGKVLVLAMLKEK